MPQQHARKKAVRAIQREYGVTYTDAAAILDDPRSEAICDVLDSGEARTHGEAIAVLDDPLNQVFCETCGWIVAWVCPECTGCGCSSGQCSGWRHAEVAALYGPTDPDDEGMYTDSGCAECGAGDSGDPYGECVCDDFAA